MDESPREDELDGVRIRRLAAQRRAQAAVEVAEQLPGVEQVLLQARSGHRRAAHPRVHPTVRAGDQQPNGHAATVAAPFRTPDRDGAPCGTFPLERIAVR